MRTHNSHAHPIDIHVGAKMRFRRRFLGLSMESLALKVGLTFQQVQKYEAGTNRISASRLHEISQALDAPISYFFDGCDGEANPTEFINSATERKVSAFMKTKEGLELAQCFPRIPAGRQRRKLLDLVRALAEGDER